MKLFQGSLERQSWWRPWRYRYHDVAAEEGCLDSSDAESGDMDELLEKGALRPFERHQSRACQYMPWLTVINFVVLLATITLNSGARLRWSFADTNACVKDTSYFSPVVESIPIEHHHILMNGTLWPGEEPSFSRREPGDPEGEKVWEFIEAVKPFPITREDVVALGKDPNTVARFPDEIFGLGNEAYIAALDIQHKLHCLNVIRKMAFADYGENAPKKTAHGQLWWLHIRHCVDMLTQDMMCHADADLITYRWTDTQPVPAPDMSLNRKCRNFDDLLKYRDEHKVDIDTYDAMEKPRSGIVQIPHEPGFYAMYGFGSSDLYPNGEGYKESLPETNWFGIPHHISH